MQPTGLKTPWAINKVGDEFYISEIDSKTGKVAGSIEGYGRIPDIRTDGKDVYFTTNNTDGRRKPDNDDDKLILLPGS